MSGSRGKQSGTFLDRLMRAVEHLAWPADRQRAYLADLGVAPLLDELALEFDDAYKPIQADFRSLGIDDSTRQTIDSIDQILVELTQESNMEGWAWDWAALHNDKRWLDIRRLAHAALAGLEKLE